MAKKSELVCEALRRRNVRGALWRHADVDQRVSYTLAITRSSKNTQGEWKDETIYLPLEDGPRARAILAELETTAYEEMQIDYEERKKASA